MLGLALAVTAALAALASTSGAAPVIETDPAEIRFDPVTLGDTTRAIVKIVNSGNATLTVTSIDVPAGVRVSPEPPMDVDAGRSLLVGIEYAPPDSAKNDTVFVFHSNDPVNPALSVVCRRVVLPLAIDATALTTGGTYPLGEAIIVQSFPGDGVHVEEASLFFHSAATRGYDEVPMTWNGRSFVGIIFGNSVQEGGVTFYVVARNRPFRVVVPPDSSTRPYKVDVDSPRNFQLTPESTGPGSVWPEGKPIDFKMILERGTSFVDGTLYYRMQGDSLYEATKILESGGITGVNASIPSVAVGPRGLEYWSEIHTLTTTLTRPESTPDKRPYQLQISVDNLAESRTTPAGRYRMLSIPLELTGGAGLPAILSDQPEFGGYDPVRWRAFRYLPDQQRNVEYSPATADAFTLVPGRALWLVSRDAHSIDTAPVPAVSTLGPNGHYSITLAPGWNQFGNPFAFPVPWDQVRSSVPMDPPVAYDPDLGDYSDAPVTQLDPFQGYFIQNPSAGPESLAVYAFAADRNERLVARRPARDGLAAGERPPVASVRIEARTPAGAYRLNRIGLADDASDERDARDRAEPPPAPGSSVRVTISNRGWSTAAGLYRCDFRPASGPGATWELEITSARAGEPVDVTLVPEVAPPTGTALRWVDREQGSVIDLDPRAPEQHVRVLSYGPSRSYKVALVMGNPSYVSESASAPVPERLTLDPVSPNPSRDAQRVRFGLPRAAKARLEVFDAAGRRVATLVDGALPAGFHSVVWRPGEGGQRPRSGIYFHRLTVDGQTRTARAVLVP